MATQVKFYNVDALPASPSAGGLYFVNENDGYGQLYRGSQLIGAARVTEVDYDTDGKLHVPHAVRGDINISTQKGAEIYKGSYGLQQVWLPLSDASLTKRVENLEAVVSYSGEGDKVVTADTITATTGNFTNLNVSDTATFKATTVSATTLSVATEDAATFGGSTISAIADRQIAAIAEASASAADDGVEVKVVTQSGSVKEVDVVVAATSQAADINKDNEALARAKDVAAYIADVAKAMHFRGLATVDKDGKVTPADGVTTNVAGDVVITTTGKEYVWTGDAW